MAEKELERPGVLATVAAGFDVVTRHWWLILLPLLLDVFYWIGPQLRSQTLIQQAMRAFVDIEAAAPIREQLELVAGNTNLATSLSVPLLGIPGLMAGFVMPEQTPIQPAGWDLPSVELWLLTCLALMFAGILLATVYFVLIGRAVVGASPEGDEQGRTIAPPTVSRLPRYWLATIGLAVAMVLVAIAVYIPSTLVAIVAAFISPALVSLVILGALGVVIWLWFYLGYSLPGILLGRRPVLLSLLDSVQLVQQNWWQAAMLWLLTMGLRNVLSWLWLTVDTGSWLTLLSIAGYAFINTSLIAATFIFYRDRIPRVWATQKAVIAAVQQRPA